MGKLNVSIIIDMYTDGAPSETAVSDQIDLTMPRLPSKYIQLPKILEGVFEQLAERHNNRVTQWEVQQEREKRERRERPQLWDDYPTEAKPVRQPTPEEMAETFAAGGIAYPVIDGQALIDATDEQIMTAVAEAVAATAQECGLLTEDHDGE